MKLRSIHHFKSLNKGCVLYTGASYTRETTVCTYINHILVSLNKEIATHFLLIKQLFVPSVHVVRPKIKKQYKEPVPLP